jgi:hypothetical protein
MDFERLPTWPPRLIVFGYVLISDHGSVQADCVDWSQTERFLNLKNSQMTKTMVLNGTATLGYHFQDGLFPRISMFIPNSPCSHQRLSHAIYQALLSYSNKHQRQEDELDTSVLTTSGSSGRTNRDPAQQFHASRHLIGTHGHFKGPPSFIYRH